MKQMRAQIEMLSKKLAEQGEKQDKVTAQVAKAESEDKARAKAIKLYGQLRLSAVVAGEHPYDEEFAP